MSDLKISANKSSSLLYLRDDKIKLSLYEFFSVNKFFEKSILSKIEKSCHKSPIHARPWGGQSDLFRYYSSRDEVLLYEFHKPPVYCPPRFDFAGGSASLELKAPCFRRYHAIDVIQEWIC